MSITACGQHGCRMKSDERLQGDVWSYCETPNRILDQTTHAVTVVQEIDEDGDTLPEDVREARKFAENHEQELMKQLDDDLLARIFSGWCRSDQGRDCKRFVE